MTLVQFDNQLVLDKVILILTIAKTISKKRSAKASASKPFGKPPPGDKTLGIDPEIRFYAIEDGYETEEVKQAEILVIYDSSLAASKQNLITSKFPYIDMFDHEGPAVISKIRDLTAGVFEHLYITSPMDVGKGTAYTQLILRGAALKKYVEVLVTYR